jgi:hypothetical protein
VPCATVVLNGNGHIQVTEYQIDVNDRNRQRCSVSAGMCSVSTSRTGMVNGRQISNKPTISGCSICYVAITMDCKHIINFTDVLLTYLLTYLLTPWSRVLENLTGLQLVQKFPAFYGTRRFITAFTSARHLSLSWGSSIQSISPHPTS